MLSRQILYCGEQLRSLHLARVPFCESLSIQEKFITQITNQLPSPIKAIGLHLCGDYRNGLGRLGIGTDFVYTAENKQKSRQFINLIKNKTNQQILLENANFYDSNASQAISTIEFANELCSEYNLELILDLAHLIINATNLGLNPYYLLGKFDLNLVKVIHLSGIVKSINGILHDGHTLQVSPEVWSMLETVLSLINHSVTLVLEHTDSIWINQQDLFLADWQKMKQIASVQTNPSQSPQSINLDEVGIGYMANLILPQYCPEIYHLLGKENFAKFGEIWGNNFLAYLGRKRKNAYVSIGNSEYLKGSNDYIDVVQSFKFFFQELAIKSKKIRINSQLKLVEILE